MTTCSMCGQQQLELGDCRRCKADTAATGLELAAMREAASEARLFTPAPAQLDGQLWMEGINA